MCWLTAPLYPPFSLSGTIPASLFAMPNLTYVELRDNALSGALPRVNQLSPLTRLHLSDNALSGTIPSLSRLPVQQCGNI